MDIKINDEIAELQSSTLFNHSTDLSLNGSWICSQTIMPKSIIHREQSFHVEMVVMLSHKKSDSVINIEYSDAEEPPVLCSVSHQSGQA